MTINATDLEEALASLSDHFIGSTQSREQIGQALFARKGTVLNIQGEAFRVDDVDLVWNATGEVLNCSYRLSPVNPSILVTARIGSAEHLMPGPFGPAAAIDEWRGYVR